jgi:hypothetical protein
MNIELVQEFLLRCLAVNAGIVLLWGGAIAVVGDSIHRLHGKFFKYLTREKFDEIHYSGLRSYKMATIFLNVVPMVALSLM